MRRARKSGPRRLVDAVKLTAVGVAAFLVVATAAAGSAEVVVEPGPPGVASLDHLDELMKQHDCSVTGFGPDVVPGSALVLHETDVQLVTFDEGWAVYTGTRPGRLMALCRGDL